MRLLLILICDLIYRFIKYCKYIWYGKHEFERICESSCDIYKKTMDIDRWLMRTNCTSICDYFVANIYYKTANKSSKTHHTIDKIVYNYRNPSRFDGRKKKSNIHLIVNLDDGDMLLKTVSNEMTDEFVELIKRSKNTKFSRNCEQIFRDIIYRIICYNISLLVMLRVASMMYDSSISSHCEKLMSLWNNLVKLDKTRTAKGKMINHIFPTEINSEVKEEDSIVSGRWSHIGFQGEDPGTDFRGMGLLGLEQLEYLSRRSKYLALDLLSSSLNLDCEYPFAIVGINITYNLVNLFKDGSMKHFYYDCGDVLFRNRQRSLSPIKTFNDLYIELFLRFDCFWRQSKPENIFAFRGLMEKFIEVIKMDLCNRTFSMKFIY